MTIWGHKYKYEIRANDGSLFGGADKKEDAEAILKKVERENARNPFAPPRRTFHIEEND